LLITSECMRVTPCFTLEYTIMKNQSQYPKGRYVDINVHIGEGIDIEGQPFTFNSLLEWMDNNEISQAMVLSSICIPEEKNINGMSNDEALKEFEKYQSRLFPFCVIHPNFQSTKKDLVKLLQQFKEKGVKGFGELKPRNDLTIDDPKCMRLYEACSKVQLPVLFHMDDQHCIDNVGLSRLQKVLQALSDCTFIAHGPGWWASISGDVKTQEEMRGFPYPPGKIAPGGAVDPLLEKFPNLYGDLSASSWLNAVKRDPEFGHEFLIRCAEKLLFGTDTFKVNQDWGHFEFYENIDLPKHVQKKIFRDNGRNLLQLG
jgi:predicted TIM-barrel fold metal-dependent hydrolase